MNTWFTDTLIPGPTIGTGPGGGGSFFPSGLSKIEEGEAVPVIPPLIIIQSVFPGAIWLSTWKNQESMEAGIFPLANMFLGKGDAAYVSGLLPALLNYTGDVGMITIEWDGFIDVLELHWDRLIDDACSEREFSAFSFVNRGSFRRLNGILVASGNSRFTMNQVEKKYYPQGSRMPWVWSCTFRLRAAH